MSPLSEHVVRRFMASQEQQGAVKVLQKVERFLDAYEKEAQRFEEAAKKAESPEEGFLSGKALHKSFQSLSKFSQVARNLGQDDLEDLYYNTEGVANNKVREIYNTLMYQVLQIFSGSQPPNLSTAVRDLKPVSGGVVLFQPIPWTSGSRPLRNGLSTPGRL